MAEHAHHPCTARCGTIVDLPHACWKVQTVRHATNMSCHCEMPRCVVRCRLMVASSTLINCNTIRHMPFVIVVFVLLLSSKHASFCTTKCGLHVQNKCCRGRVLTLCSGYPGMAHTHETEAGVLQIPANQFRLQMVKWVLQVQTKLFCHFEHGMHDIRVDCSNRSEGKVIWLRWSGTSVLPGLCMVYTRLVVSRNVFVVSDQAEWTAIKTAATSCQCLYEQAVPVQECDSLLSRHPWPQKDQKAVGLRAEHSLQVKTTKHHIPRSKLGCPLMCPEGRYGQQ